MLISNSLSAFILEPDVSCELSRDAEKGSPSRRAAPFDLLQPPSTRRSTSDWLVKLVLASLVPDKGAHGKFSARDDCPRGRGCHGLVVVVEPSQFTQPLPSFQV